MMIMNTESEENSNKNDNSDEYDDNNNNGSINNNDHNHNDNDEDSYNNNLNNHDSYDDNNDYNNDDMNNYKSEYDKNNYSNFNNNQYLHHERTETSKRGVLPNIMVLRQICDFPDLSVFTEMENQQKIGSEIFNSNHSSSESTICKYGSATVEGNANENENGKNNAEKFYSNNYYEENNVIKKREEIENKITDDLIAHSDKMKVKNILCLSFFAFFFT